MVGGLTSTYHDQETLIVRNLPLTNFKFIIAVPEAKEYQPPPLAERVSGQDAIENLRRLPLVMEALREGNLKLLAQVIHSPLLRPETQSRIPGFVHVAEVARLAGVLATFTSGGGPAMVFLVEKSHDRIAEVIEIAFRNIDIHAKVFVVTADTQGVVMSLMQTSV
jgi:homoserine kinase